ncbi:MAG: Wadjet anti-phage system protein JetD domain-containing protein [Syntrophomonadaceae bacterium]
MNLFRPDWARIYTALKDEADRWPRTYILLDRLYSSAANLDAEMPTFLQSPMGKAAFSQAVQQLVSEQRLVPVGRKPYTQQGLHQKYRINRNPADQDDQLRMEIIRTIKPPASFDFYIKHPGEFLQDRPIIASMIDFLTHEDQYQTVITVNERAYQMFGDEKFFKGGGKGRSRGEMVLKKLGLNCAHLRCMETVEPFFSFQTRAFYARQTRDVYIIENKDTFWSFKRCLMDVPSIIKADMLIYGEGRKIISSFGFIDECGIDVLRDRIFYFGDLDAEGINIFCELRDAYQGYNIVPFRAGYQAILEIGLDKPAVKTPKRQAIKPANIERFIEAFDSSWGIRLKRHLEEGFYIPQEALSASAMQERFGEARDGSSDAQI